VDSRRKRNFWGNKMRKDVFERLIELIKEDKELHDAIIDFIKARTEHELYLARKKCGPRGPNPPL
jgi:hypothetical protein